MTTLEQHAYFDDQLDQGKRLTFRGDVVYRQHGWLVTTAVYQIKLSQYHEIVVEG